jgi:hypothetical protein
MMWMVRFALGHLWSALGPLIGVVLGWLLSTRSQESVWVTNSRKEEWRELISTLQRCQQTIREVKSKLPQGMTISAREPIREAQLEGARVILDRIFILESLKKNSVKEDWDRIQRMSDLASPLVAAPLQSAFSLTDFDKEWSALHSKLADLARKDLRLKT